MVVSNVDCLSSRGDDRLYPLKNEVGRVGELKLLKLGQRFVRGEREGTSFGGSRIDEYEIVEWICVLRILQLTALQNPFQQSRFHTGVQTVIEKGGLAQNISSQFGSAGGFRPRQRLSNKRMVNIQQ